MKTLLKTLAAGTIIGAAALSVANAADTKPAALIIAQGGLGDGSWNDTANAGFKAGVKATGIKGKAIESKDVVAQGEEIMRRAADGGFGLVASLEWIHGEPMEKLAVGIRHCGCMSCPLLEISRSKIFTNGTLSVPSDQFGSQRPQQQRKRSIVWVR